LVNLRCLKLKPPPYGVSAGGLNPQHAVSAVTNYPSVSQLKHLESLTVAMPVLCTEQTGSIAVLTGLQVRCCSWLFWCFRGLFLVALPSLQQQAALPTGVGSGVRH
jgi:hypothetical protein